MVGVPELGGDEDVFSLRDALVKSSAETSADLLLVLVAQRSVEVAVARLQGRVDSLRHFSGRRLPGACIESNKRFVSRPPLPSTETGARTS